MEGATKTEREKTTEMKQEGEGIGKFAGGGRCYQRGSAVPS